jgi:ABC-type polysaccharide/polyol phosphate transport system ATPase subunit
MPAIEVKNLVKRYHGAVSPYRRLKHIFGGETASPSGPQFVALDNVSFTLERGTALGVVGPNGAGKSTLLKILAGIVDPTTGEAILHGKVASIIELGAGFHPDFTGRENVFLNTSVLGRSEEFAHEAFEQIARFSELGKYLDMPVRTYSSGMFVRLAFAVAISTDPDILLVDEALAVGDAVFAHRCLSRIRQMREQGVTIVFVSHDTNTIAGLCDRALFLDQGTIAADGPPKDVIHQYLLRVAERLTNLGEKGDSAAAFHEIGAVSTTDATSEKRFGSFFARIIQIEILDSEGMPTEKLLAGQIALFRIEVRFQKQIENPVFGIMLKNRFGVEIFGTNTALRKQQIGTCEAGKLVNVEFRVPMYLGNGVYTASFAVHTEGGHFYDYRVDARIFEVVGEFENIGIAALPATIEISAAQPGAEREDDLDQQIYANAPSQLTLNRDAEGFLSGDWYSAQQAPDGEWYRWTGKNAAAHLRCSSNFTKAVLRAKTVYPEIDQCPVLLRLQCSTDSKTEATLTNHDWKEIEIPLGLSGSDAVIAVSFIVDPTWCPREFSADSTDDRDLGVMISYIELR